MTKTKFIIKYTQDEELKKAIKEKLKQDPHCPCQLQKTDDTICMCKEFREQETEGFCHCGLYQKIKKEVGIN